MFYYKNNTMISKTYYGVTFEPGEIKEVAGPINDPKFIRYPDGIAKRLIKSNTQLNIKKPSPNPKPKVSKIDNQANNQTNSQEANLDG